MTQGELYCTAFYFTVTTITTVGYGDISGFNIIEKVMCIFLMLAGTFFFAFASGTLTAMIQNYDSQNAKYTEKLLLLKKVSKDFNVPNNLYFEV